MAPKRFFPSLLLIIVVTCLGCQNEPPASLPQNENPELSKEHFKEIMDEVPDHREKIARFNKILRSVENRNDTLLPLLLDYKIYFHNALKEYDSALYFSDSLIRVAQHQQDTSFVAMGYYRKSKINFYLENNEELFKNAFESRRLYLSIGDSTRAGRRSVEMANTQQRIGDYLGGQESAIQALKFLVPKDKSDSSEVGSVYNSIGISYRGMELYEDALAEYQNALRYAPTLQDSLLYLNNIGLVLRDQQKYDAAIDLFRSTLEKLDTTKTDARARFIENLAYARWLQNPEADVEEELLQALQIRKENNLKEGLLPSYSHLINFYRDSNRQLSREYAQKLLKGAREYGSTTSRLEALENLVELSTGEEAKNYSLNYIRLSDSLDQAHLKSRNAFAKIRFDEERKQQEILNLEAQNRLQVLEANQLRIENISLVLAALLLLVLFAFLFYYLRQRHKKEKILESYKTENRISKVIHDELANDIFNVMSSLEPVAPVPTIDKLEKIYLRTRDISRENSELDTGEHYVENLLSTLSNNTPEGSRLIIRGESSVKWEKISEEKKIIIYRVLQELMVNMKKHSDAKLVAISFSVSGKHLEINYSDTGKGWSRDKGR